MKRTTRAIAQRQATVDAQQKIQDETDAKDAKRSPSSKTKKSPQTATSKRSSSPLPPQHLRKPGLESELVPRPEFEGSGKLAGKVAVITGGDSGIGRAVGVLFARERAGACIVNTGSETGLYGAKHLLDYSATKGAIHAFTKALATNVIDRGIRVNAVAPGPVWTPLNPADQSATDVAEFGASTDMKRPAQPDEISPAYVILASSLCSSYITGIVLPIMGSVPR